MKTYVISLQDSFDRRKSISTKLELNGLNYSFFNAAKGKDQDLLKKINKQINYSAFKSDGEIGCAISHLALYKKLIDSNEKAMLILEDDIILSPKFLKTIESLRQNISKNDLILIGYGSSITLSYSDSKYISSFSKKTKIEKIKLWYPRESLMGTIGYIIGSEAAEKIFYFSKKIDKPSDVLLNYAPVLGIDYRALVDQVVFPDFTKFESLIRKEHFSINNYTSFKDKLYLIKKIVGFLLQDFFIFIFSSKTKKRHGYISFFVK